MAVTSSSQAALPPHPRLLLPDSDLPALKQRVADNDWARSALQSLRSKYDKTLNTPITLPDRGGQWSHWYACPTHGARLRTESPTRHVCPVDGQVFTGYPYDDVPLTGIHTALAESVRDLGLLYRVTGDQQYAARARDIALAYADKYLSYAYHDTQGRPKVPGGRVTPQTLNEAIWLISLARGVDQIWDTLTPDQIDTLKTKLFYPCVKDVILPHKQTIHNIQCWKNSAVGLTALLFDDPDLLKDAVDSPDHGLRAQLAKGVTADGQWEEGAWGYHFYTLSAMLPLTEALRICGTDLYNDSLHRMFSAPLLLAMPDGRLPAFNDSDTATAAGNPDYELGLARFHDPLLAAPLRDKPRNSLQALLYGVSPLPDAPKESAASQNYPASGYAILRSASTWLCLKYGPHGGYHGHFDKLSFVLFANGGILADDPGNSPYGLPIHNGWHKTTLAHNTISLDQKNQSPAAGSCLAFVTGQGYSATLLDAGPVYPNATIRRAAFLLGDSLIFVDQVTATDGQLHTIDLAYHPAGIWHAHATERWGKRVPAAMTQPSTNSPAYTYLRDLRGLTTTQPFSTGLDLPGLGAVTFAATDTPTTYFGGYGIGKNTSNLVPILIARRTAASATFVWSVATTRPATTRPAAKLTRVDVPNGAVAVRIEQDGKSWLLVSNPDGNEVKVDDVTTREKLLVHTP